MIHPVHPRAWQQVEPLIAQACKRSPEPMTVQAVRDMVECGDGLVLSVPGGVLVLQRVDENLHAVIMSGVGLMGHMRGIVEFWRNLAQHIGCTGITFSGRKGWHKIAPLYGFWKDEEGIYHG